MPTHTFLYAILNILNTMKLSILILIPHFSIVNQQKYILHIHYIRSSIFQDDFLASHTIFPKKNPKPPKNHCFKSLIFLKTNKSCGKPQYFSKIWRYTQLSFIFSQTLAGIQFIMYPK